MSGRNLPRMFTALSFPELRVERQNDCTVESLRGCQGRLLLCGGCDSYGCVLGCVVCVVFVVLECVVNVFVVYAAVLCVWLYCVCGV